MVANWLHLFNIIHRVSTQLQLTNISI